jgi:hypothetical protein
MIKILLFDLRWRLLTLALVAVILYALEPGFHQHDETELLAVEMGPLGVSATLSYFAGISMIVLLAGFISRERREGYTRLFFSYPTSPIAYYGLRWGIAFLIAVLGAALFLIVGQLVAWGAIRGGWSGMALPVLSALIYGGLMAFFSALLPRGDAWAAFLLFLPTFFPQLLTLGLAGAGTTMRQVVLLLLPPQGALQDVWQGLLLESFGWGAAAFAAGYGVLFLIAGGLILKVREWP